MFSNLVKSFLRQVVITRAQNISEISTMLLLNYRTIIWTKITQDKKSRAGWTEKKQNKKQGHC